jgi:hypothetical protein
MHTGRAEPGTTRQPGEHGAKDALGVTDGVEDEVGDGVGVRVCVCVGVGVGVCVDVDVGVGVGVGVEDAAHRSL